MNNTSSKKLTVEEIKKIRDSYNDIANQKDIYFMNSLFAGLDDIINRLERAKQAESLLRRLYSEADYSADVGEPISGNCIELDLVKKFLEE
jgi:hypothetical protein